MLGLSEKVFKGVARAGGMDPRTVDNYLSGAVKHVRPSKICRIEEFLGLPEGTLLSTTPLQQLVTLEPKGNVKTKEAFLFDVDLVEARLLDENEFSIFARWDAEFVRKC